MAELNTYTEPYTDLPLTQFPASEDDWDRMSDVSASMVSLVQDYNKLYNEGRFSDAKKLLDNNEDLLRCFFNADKYNQLRDATIAMQRFLLNEVQNLIKEVAKNTIGIEDNPTEDQKGQTAYSAAKVDANIEQAIDNLIGKYLTKYTVTIPFSGWNDGYPYFNTVTVKNVTADMELRVIGTIIASDASYSDTKNIVKSAGFLVPYDDGVGDEQITFKAYKKPTVDFTVILEGGK